MVMSSPSWNSPSHFLASALDPRKKSLEASSGCFSDSDTAEIWKVLEENMVKLAKKNSNSLHKRGRETTSNKPAKKSRTARAGKEKQEHEEATDLMTTLLMKKKGVMQVSDPDVTERGKSVEVQSSEELSAYKKELCKLQKQKILWFGGRKMLIFY
jgi:predicted nucleic acid-binding protein